MRGQRAQWGDWEREAGETSGGEKMAAPHMHTAGRRGDEHAHSREEGRQAVESETDKKMTNEWRRKHEEVRVMERTVFYLIIGGAAEGVWAGSVMSDR